VLAGVSRGGAIGGFTWYVIRPSPSSSKYAISSITWESRHTHQRTTGKDERARQHLGGVQTIHPPDLQSVLELLEAERRVAVLTL
jgi:hypothetical protein